MGFVVSPSVDVVLVLGNDGGLVVGAVPVEVNDDGLVVGAGVAAGAAWVRFSAGVDAVGVGGAVGFAAGVGAVGVAAGAVAEDVTVDTAGAGVPLLLSP